MNNIVLIDMDAVLTDFESNFIAYWFRKYPNEPCPIQQTQNAFVNRTKLPDDLHQKVWQIYLTPGLFATMNPIPDGAEALCEMESSGLKPFICTAPMPGHRTCLNEKQAWVEKKMPKFMRSRFIITLDKTMVKGRWLIDDLPDVTGCQKPDWTQILFTAPYNWQRTVPYRLNAWPEWRQLFQQLSAI